MIELIEGMALRRPPPKAAEVHRAVSGIAAERGWPPVSYPVVRRIIAGLDRGLIALAHGGAQEYRDDFELVLRREAVRPNDIWQADHSELDLMVLDETGRPARPWLTVILDDRSRAIAGYTVFAGDPSALRTALALRQAIWRKTDPAWPVCGVPAVLYSDHGADFTSTHIAQVCADLKTQLIHSSPGKPAYPANRLGRRGSDTPGGWGSCVRGETPGIPASHDGAAGSSGPAGGAAGRAVAPGRCQPGGSPGGQRVPGVCR